ncbi:hypothetical protein BDD43_2118 [Mucilaginibacter gracilis]|uniref:Spy/CpxP family protein refolding chaperone n=1 Tax=Mucilaginibacter gracilis TaxID=423350 RepID=A0A495IZ12_9SPHI|nr:hypothetical protein [Mucilaginibacter gracilis]RKR81956.1 hypothetical protein BDD43_2118 [Mucilaginibacter gracilis]
MKKIISKFSTAIACAILVLAALVQPAKAQDMANMKNKTPEQRAQFQTGLMKGKLQLDTVQIVKVQAINLKYAQKMEPIIKGDDGKLKKYRAAMAIQKDKDEELKKVFSAEQYKQYQAFEAELKAKMKDKMGQH